MSGRVRVRLAGLLGALALQPGLAQPASGIDTARHAERLALCANCHEPGPAQRASVDGQMTPLLHGQQPVYLASALADYAQRRRDHFFMRGIAAGLTEGEVQAVVAHFGRPVAPPRAAGRTAGTDGVAARGPLSVPAAAQSCIACHGDGSRPPAAADVPVLAGQHALYLQRAFLAYAQGSRRNAVMQAQARGDGGQPTLDDATLSGVAAWFASLPDGLRAEAEPPAAAPDAASRASRAPRRP